MALVFSRNRTAGGIGMLGVVIGPKGDAATIAVGTVTTGPEGSDATVTNVGTSNNAIFDFEIPRGDTGTAATIAVGDTTTVLPGNPAAVTNVGTSSAAIFDFDIPAGAAATIQVGTVDTVAAGSPATVTNVGTSAAAILDFEIPAGNDGTDGEMSGPGASVDGEIALYDGTDGTTLKRSNHTGVLKAASGVLAAASAGTDYLAPSAIGTTVQAYDADTAKIDVAQSWSAKQTFDTTTKIEEVLEKFQVIADNPPGSGLAFYALNGAAQYYTVANDTNFLVNVSGDGSNSLNSIMANGESITVALAITNGATPYYVTAFYIDSGVQTVKWQGGTAPSAGNANSIDVYTFCIIKTASATYTVLGAMTKFA